VKNKQPQGCLNPYSYGEFMSIQYTSLGEVAMAAAIMGFRVFPANSRNKKPLLDAWDLHATRDLGAIWRTWQKIPDAMIAVLTGNSSGRFVVDIDPKGEDPWKILAELESYVGEFDKEFIVLTPSGGLHIYVPMPPDLDLRNSAKTIWPNVDIRANGGYVIFPFSKRADGKEYKLLTKDQYNA